MEKDGGPVRDRLPILSEDTDRIPSLEYKKPITSSPGRCSVADQRRAPNSETILTGKIHLAD